jgi:hypothetical protein
MKCIHPVTKKRKVKGMLLDYVHRCGQCMPCRITRRQEWTLRNILESKCHKYNTFVTLTFDEIWVPPDGKCRKAQFQKFLKRLRKNSGKKFRYFGIGELGDIGGRPHYHILLFGYPAFFDEEIRASWQFGHVDVRELTPSGCAYVAGYATKKFTRLDGEVNERTNSQFQLMSTKPGIGYHYCVKIAQNLMRDTFNFVGDEYKYIRCYGMKLPLDKYMQKWVNYHMGFVELDQSVREQIRISNKQWKDMNYPQAENDKMFLAERKAKQRIWLQKQRKKL